jgi:hypothetical protein
MNVAPETCREKNEENKLDLLHLVGILFINTLIVYINRRLKKKVLKDFLKTRVT